MEIPDVKGVAHRQINSLEGSILGMVQIMADDENHVSVCIGGIPEVIVRTLAEAMRGNHQVKDLFESALHESNNTRFNSSMMN